MILLLKIDKAPFLFLWIPFFYPMYSYSDTFMLDTYMKPPQKLQCIFHCQVFQFGGCNQWLHEIKGKACVSWMFPFSWSSSSWLKLFPPTTLICKKWAQKPLLVHFNLLVWWLNGLVKGELHFWSTNYEARDTFILKFLIYYNFSFELWGERHLVL